MMPLPIEPLNYVYAMTLISWIIYKIILLELKKKHAYLNTNRNLDIITYET